MEINFKNKPQSQDSFSTNTLYLAYDKKNQPMIIFSDNDNVYKIEKNAMGMQIVKANGFSFNVLGEIEDMNINEVILR